MYVSGMLKQKIKAGGMKIKRYDERWSTVQAEPSVSNQPKAVFETLDEKKQGETALPDPEEATSFWNKIWSGKVVIMRKHLG